MTLTAISCVSASFCMAVGDYSRGAGAMPSPAFRDSAMAEEWDGHLWTLLRTPSPSHNAVLEGVSCTSPSACTAVGSSAARKRTLVERWNGRRWTIQPTPNFRRVGYTVLSAVSCPSTRMCIAVGTYDLGLGIAERWNGSHWTIQRLPPERSGTPGRELAPAGVSCASVSMCMTVGTIGDRTFAASWNGGNWAVQPVPSPR